MARVRDMNRPVRLVPCAVDCRQGGHPLPPPTRCRRQGNRTQRPAAAAKAATRCRHTNSCERVTAPFRSRPLPVRLCRTSRVVSSMGAGPPPSVNMLGGGPRWRAQCERAPLDPSQACVERSPLLLLMLPWTHPWGRDPPQACVELLVPTRSACCLGRLVCVGLGRGAARPNHGRARERGGEALDPPHVRGLCLREAAFVSLYQGRVPCACTDRQPRSCF